MDETRQLCEFRANAPTPDRARLAPGRQRLTDSAARRSGRRAVRTDWRLTAVGAAAAVTVAVLAAGQLGDGTGGIADPSASRVVVQAPPLDDAEALLHRIADAAAHRPTPKPRAGQWVYSRTYDAMEEGREAPPSDVVEELGIEVGPEHENWTPYADPEFENWKEGDDHSHRERYEFVAALPSAPDKLFAELREFYPSAGADEPRTAHNYRAAGVLISTWPVPPAGIARVYRAVAELDGISVLDHLVEDATGAPAIAVYLPDEEDWAREEMLFDPQTLQYVGRRSVAVENHTFEGGAGMPDGPSHKRGEVFLNTAVLRHALVAKEGQRP